MIEVAAGESDVTGRVRKQKRGELQSGAFNRPVARPALCGRESDVAVVVVVRSDKDFGGDSQRYGYRFIAGRTHAVCSATVVKREAVPSQTFVDVGTAGSRQG